MTNNPSFSLNGTGSTEADTVAAIADLLTDDLTIDGNSETHEAAEGNGSEASRDAQSADTEESNETDQQADTADQDDQDSGANEDADETESGESGLVTVTIDGKTEQLPLNEVVAGYQRGADYSRKTMALAEARKEFEATRSSFESEAQAVSQERGHYKVLLGQLQQAINQMIPHEPNWDELLANDPNEYLRQQRVWQTVHQQRQAAEAELQRVQSTEVAEQRQALQSYAQNSAQKLRESIPSWKDETVGRREVEELKQYARKTLGYSDEEIANAVDHRALLAVYKAMKFDALQSGAKNLKPVKAPTLAAGSPSRSAGQQSKRSNAAKRLERTGRVEDFAAYLEAQMDS